MLKSNKKLISVIVPVYNTSQFLKHCVDSLLEQSYRELEIFLIDGGSTDNTGEICDALAKADKRINVIHKADNGVTSDRKAGLAKSNGEYITFVDGDDWLDPDMYEQMMQAARESGADIVTSGVVRESPGDIRIILDGLDAGIYSCDKDGYLQKNMVWIGNSSEKGIIPGLWNKLFKREVIFQNYTSMDDLITHNEDEAAFIAAVLDSHTVTVIPKAFYHYRAWSGQSTYRHDERFFERFNYWMLYLRQKLSVKEHAKKLEQDIDRLALEQIAWGMDTQFKFVGENIFPRYVFPVNNIVGSDIVIYGAGLVGKSYYRQLINSKIHIVGWIDRRSDIYGGKVQPVEVIDNLKYDMVIIAVTSQDTAVKIKADLIGRGVPSEKIKWVKPVNAIDYLLNLG